MLEQMPAVGGGHDTRTGGCLNADVILWEVYTGAGSWQNLWREEVTVEQVCCQDLWLCEVFWLECSNPKRHTPQRRFTLEQFVTNCSLWEGLMSERLMEDCVLEEGLHTGAENECVFWEGAGETMCDELTAILFPHSHSTLGGGR